MRLKRSGIKEVQAKKNKILFIALFYLKIPKIPILNLITDLTTAVDWQSYSQVKNSLCKIISL